MKQALSHEMEKREEENRVVTLQERTAEAVALYRAGRSLRSVAGELSISMGRARKILVTAGAYRTEVADEVREAFQRYSRVQSREEALLSVMNELKRSRASVLSYLPYDRNGETSGGEEKAPRDRFESLKRLQEKPTEEALWETIVGFQGEEFQTFAGLPFTYQLRRGRNGAYTRELWIDRRENSKSLAWSSVRLAFEKVKGGRIVVERPKALGDLRGASYIYALFLRFGLIEAPEKG